MTGVGFYSDIFRDSFAALWTGVAEVLPEIIVAILVFIIGWLVASLLEHGVERVVKASKLDNLLEHTGIDELLKKAGYKLDSGFFIGSIVKWFFIILFLQFSLDIVGLTEINVFLGDVLTYLPRVVVAIIILFAGSILADFASRLAVGSAKAAGIRESAMMGTLTKWMIWVFAIIIALGELEIARQFTQTIVIGLVGMIALAGGLAFGLGGKDAAAKVLDRIPHKADNTKK